LPIKGTWKEQNVAEKLVSRVLAFAILGAGPDEPAPKTGLWTVVYLTMKGVCFDRALPAPDMAPAIGWVPQKATGRRKMPPTRPLAIRNAARAHPVTALIIPPNGTGIAKKGLHQWVLFS